MLNLLINSLMKKQLFLVVVAALAMASCSKDESTGINNGNAIDFRAAMQTRASETTTANITNFFVTALDKNNANYFSDAEFTKDGAFFTSTPAYYWPSDGSNLSFFAYSPSAADLGATVTINSTTKTLADFEPATTIADQKDFITATATGSKTDEAAGVALTFGHRLSQIEIKAKNTNDGYVYKVQGVRIGQPVSKATFDFGTTSWQLGSVKTNYEATYAGSEKTLTGTAASIMAVEDDNAMLIPQQLIAWTPDTDKTNTNKGAYLAVKVNITTKDGARVYPSVGEYDWVAVAVNTKWEPGQKYVYTLDFSNGAGKVDPEKPMPCLRPPVRKTRQWMENCTVICFVSQSPKRTAGIRSCDAVLPGRKRRALPLRKTSRKYFRSGEKTLRTRCSCTLRSPTESPHRTRMCKPTDCRRVPRPSKRGPFTIRSAYWLRFIRGLGARIPACRIICTMSR